ncbi:hypothetical protein BV898_17872 [Hypsibius exemplaris]|uniref:Uncharacterized protein n=1 Tax=Hypsibius exemplaris TaxID=2072580 RepID=A0A9X6NHQ7_HYPEX|nr:hypothetical protein BV898_17872 [Hypsibius exemplaris]
MKFYVTNCKTKVQIPFGKRWKIGSRKIIRGVTNTAHNTEIITTCAFYNSMDFDSNGVTDCKEANNENRCGSAAPWSGRYSGSPDQGFKLNGTITKTGNDAGSG